MHPTGACSAMTFSGTCPGGASASSDQSVHAVGRCEERRRRRLNCARTASGDRPRMPSTICSGVATGSKMVEERRRFAAHPRGERHVPEAVDAGEVRRHVLHRPLLAAARRVPLRGVEGPQQRKQPLPVGGAAARTGFRGRRRTEAVRVVARASVARGNDGRHDATRLPDPELHLSRRRPAGLFDAVAAQAQGRRPRRASTRSS